MFKNVPLFNNI